MIRNLKVLGLALVAAFALSAMAASAASAQGMITSPTSPFWLKGADEVAPPTSALTAFGGTTECTHATYTGGKVGATDANKDHVGLTSGAKEFTITPQYTDCHTFGGALPETITMNGCDYVIKIGATKSAGLYDVTADLVCEVGKEVTIDIYGSEAGHTAGTVACVIHIPSQSGLKGGTLKDEGNGHLTLGGTVEGITLTKTVGAPGICPTEETSAIGKLDLAVTLTGENAATNGTKVNLTLSD